MKTAIAITVDQESPVIKNKKYPRLVQHFNVADNPDKDHYMEAREALDCARIMMKLCSEHNRALVQIEYYLPPATHEQAKQCVSVMSNQIWRFYPLSDNGEPPWEDLFDDIIFMCPSSYHTDITVCDVSPMVWVDSLQYHCENSYGDWLTECYGCCDCVTDANTLPDLGRPERILDIFQPGKFEEYWLRRTGQKAPVRQLASVENAQAAEERGDLKEAEEIYKRMIDDVQAPGEIHLGCSIKEKIRLLAEFYERHGILNLAYLQYSILLQGYIPNDPQELINPQYVAPSLEKLAELRKRYSEWLHESEDFDLEDGKIINYLFSQGKILEKLDRFEEAEEVYLLAKALVEVKPFNEHGWDIIATLEKLILFYGKIGASEKLEKITEILEQVKQLNEVDVDYEEETSYSYPVEEVTEDTNKPINNFAHRWNTFVQKIANKLTYSE